MMTTWFQVEFYSDQDRCWVPLFARETSSAEAEKKRRDWLGDARSRVVKVTQTIEEVKGAVNERKQQEWT